MRNQFITLWLWLCKSCYICNNGCKNAFMKKNLRILHHDLWPAVVCGPGHSLLWHFVKMSRLSFRCCSKYFINWVELICLLAPISSCVVIFRQTNESPKAFSEKSCLNGKYQLDYLQKLTKFYIPGCDAWLCLQNMILLSCYKYYDIQRIVCIW